MQNKSIQKTGRLHLQLTGFSQQGDKQCSKQAKAILKYVSVNCKHIVSEKQARLTACKAKESRHIPRGDL